MVHRGYNTPYFFSEGGVICHGKLGKKPSRVNIIILIVGINFILVTFAVNRKISFNRR